MRTTVLENFLTSKYISILWNTLFDLSWVNDLHTYVRGSASILLLSYMNNERFDAYKKVSCWPHASFFEFVTPIRPQFFPLLCFEERILWGNLLTPRNKLKTPSKLLLLLKWLIMFLIEDFFFFSLKCFMMIQIS